DVETMRTTCVAAGNNQYERSSYLTVVDNRDRHAKYSEENMANQKQSYQCFHDARPGCCIEVNCINWNHLQPTDIEAIFGKRSSSILAARLAVTDNPEYQRLRLIAVERHLIPS